MGGKNPRKKGETQKEEKKMLEYGTVIIFTMISAVIAVILVGLSYLFGRTARRLNHSFPRP